MRDSTNQIYLDVPFTEKEEVKALGAHWDATKHKWYCAQNEANKQTFSKWILKPNAKFGRSSNKAAHDGFTLSEFIYKGAPKVSRFVPFLTIQAERIALLSGYAQCYKCKDSTEVHALVVLSGQWSNLSLKSPDTSAHSFAQPRVYGFVQKVPDEIASQIKNLAPGFRYRKSAKPMDCVYSNRCSHCDSPIKESFLHFKTEGTFSPDSIASSLADKAVMLTLRELDGEGEIIACDSEVTFLNADACWADTFDDRPTPDLSLLLNTNPTISGKAVPQTSVSLKLQEDKELRTQYIASLAKNCLVNTVMQLEANPDSWNRARLVITLPEERAEGGAICSLQMVQGEQITSQENINLSGQRIRMDLPTFDSIKKREEGYNCSIVRKTLPFHQGYKKMIELFALAQGLSSDALLDFNTPLNRQTKALVFSVFKQGSKSNTDFAILKRR